MKEKILVSACLVGSPCRYDGRSVPSEDVIRLSERYELMPVCPEVAGGLPTPRIPSERVGDLIINRAGQDVSAQYKRGALYALELCRLHGIRLALLKEKSPSCGSGLIYDGSFSGTLTEGNGVTTQLLTDNGIRVVGESQAKNLYHKLDK